MIARNMLLAGLVLGSCVLAGCPCGEEMPVELTPLSGPFGYHVEGPWGLEGTLTKAELTDAVWRLEATFQFPSSGYTLLAPQVMVAESYPEQVSIEIPVLQPEGVVLPVITERQVVVEVPASNEAEFDIVVAPYCMRAAAE